MRDAWASGFVVAMTLALAGSAVGQATFEIALPDIRYVLTGDPLALEPGECGTTSARVFNVGNSTLTLRFAGRQTIGPASDARPSVQFTHEPASARLAPNESVDVTIHACAFPNAADGAANFSIDVVVFPPGASAGSFAIPASVHAVSTDASLPPAAWLALGGALAVGASWALIRRLEWLRYALLGALAPLYTRLAPSRLLEQEKREAIYRLIEQEPGIRFSALLTQTGLPNGVLVHHLRQLERHLLVVSRREGALRRFAASPAHFPPPAPKPLTPMQSRVLDLLAARPLTQREIAGALGLTQQGANRHVKALERRGLLAIRYHDGEWRCHATTPPLQS